MEIILQLKGLLKVCEPLLYMLVMAAGMESERFPWEQTCRREAQLSVWWTRQI